MAQLYIAFGKEADAIVQIEIIKRLDPLSPLIPKLIARLLYVNGQFANAVESASDSLDLEPDDYESLIIYGAAKAELGFYKEALDAFERSMERNFNLEALSMKGYVYARMLDHTSCQNVLSEIKRHEKPGFMHSIKYAKIALAKQDLASTFDLLDQAVSEHDADIVALKCDPRWKEIRDKKQFLQILSSVGL